LWLTFAQTGKYLERKREYVWVGLVAILIHMKKIDRTRSRDSSPESSSEEPVPPINHGSDFRGAGHSHLGGRNGEPQAAQSEPASRPARFTDLFDRAPVGILRLSEQGMILEANLTAAGLLGMPRDELERTPLRRFLAGEDDNSCDLHLKELFASGRDQEFDLRMRKAGGAHFWAHLTANAAEGCDGAPSCRVVMHDITERRRIGEALRMEHEQMGNVLRVTRTGLSIIDGEYNLLLVDRCRQKVHGNPAGRKCHEYFRNLSAPCPDCGAPQALRTNQVVILQDVVQREQNRPVEIHHYPFQDSDGRRLVAVISIDISERLRAREALKASETRFKELLQSVPTVAVQGYALDGTVRYWNRASETFYGYTSEEALGKNLLDLIIPLHLRDAVRAAIRGIVETGRTIPAAELELLRKDGSLIPVYSSHALVHLPGQEPELFCLDVDLTERKRAEAEQAKLQAQFLQAQKMESVGRLAGGVAHDFNNLLMGIMGYTHLCRQKIGPDHPVVEWLDEIKKSAHRSANLTRQLLAFARKQTISPRILDLNEAVTGMLGLLHQLIGEEIALAWGPGGNLGPVRMDPSQIDQILANLVVNARDAIGGVGHLSIATGMVVVTPADCTQIPEAVPGEYVVLTVSDDGCGMDRETLSHIFEPFFTTKAPGQGTGLGLATVYGIVKQNGGFIQLHSEPGKGTTFQIHLPRCLNAVEIETAARPASALPRGTETILLVEDEKAVRVTVTLFLEMEGYTVLAAANPAEAMLAAGQHSDTIHLLITDVVMPSMNGRDLAATLAAARPAMKCLFISGYSADVIAHRGILEEGVHFLAKPFTRDVLARKVHEVLNGGSQARTRTDRRRKRSGGMPAR
jgi:two-component system cell cycle sensor histidine kinase/response regulator CckA